MQSLIQRISSTTRNGALLAASLLAVAPLAAQDISTFPADIPASTWFVETPTEAGVDAVRSTLNTTTDEITLRTGTTQPGNTFSWLRGPRFVATPAPNDLPGNLAGVRVRYRFNTDFDRNQQLPELRVRLNMADFEHFGAGGISPREFLGNTTGEGIAEAWFDRRVLTANNRLRVFIDYIGQTGAPIDPNFALTITEVTYYQVNATLTSNDITGQITAAYMDEDGDVQVHLGGNTNRQRIRSSATSYATSGRYALTLDSGRLNVYSTANNLTSIEVEDQRTVSAAISNEHVIYITNNGGDRQVFYYNILTAEKRRLSDTDSYVQVFAGNGGVLIAAQVDDGLVNLAQYNPQRPADGLVRIVEDQDELLVRGTDTGLVSAENAPLAATSIAMDGWVFE